MRITHTEKEKISQFAAAYVDRFDSQNQAAATLPGVSSATLSQVINKNWDAIADKMWRTIMAALSFNPDEQIIVETKPFTQMQALFTDAQQNQLAMGIIGEAGTGKSFAIKYFATSNRSVYVLSCREYWNRKWFLMELLTKMGRPHFGMTIADMMQEAVRHILMKDNPVLIFDEYDKLPDHVLSFFITMYNELEDRCGFIIIATNHLKKRIVRGVELNKKGYNEIYSRLGRRFIELPQVSPEDMMQVCLANGITDKPTIKDIILESDADLRRVHRKIHAVKAKQRKNESNQPND